MKQAFLKYLNYPKHLTISFLFIFFIHLLFKSLHLDYAGLWYDETFGLWYSQQDWGLIKHTSEWDLNPPLYYYFLWIWRNLFGISEFSIRFSSVLFSSLSAGMLYVFSARYFNKTTALISILIFTASSNILFFAHEARCYSLVIFLSLCSSWLFFSLLNKKSYPAMIGLGIINFLLIYTHYLTGFILFFQFAIAIFLRRDFLKCFLMASSVTLAFCLWRFTKKTLALIFNHEKSFWLQKATFYDLKTAFYDFFNGPVILSLFALLILGAAGILFYKRKELNIQKEEKIKFAYTLLCGIITLSTCFLIGTKTPVFLMRYLLYTSPFMYISIGFLFSLLPLQTKYITTIVVIIICTYSAFNLNLKTEKSMDFRGAMNVIKKFESPNTAILVETRDVGPLFAYYYDKSIFSEYYKMEATMKDKNIYFISNTNDLANVDTKKYGRLILTQTFERQNPENEKLLRSIESEYKKKVEIYYYNEVNILVFCK